MPKLQISFHGALQLVSLFFYCGGLFGILQIAIPREEGAAEIITLFAKCYPQAVCEKERGANQ